ncbi:leucine-rich melanocyte differentiation-associated protein [Thalassophryne amazonica]|uniref:leucine-rich melanocyte differentiation-associated protein n=1 Tax=Thalassophryne amazonica TaxID=390379 RepID=UPI0014718249|nr:leucine-rich melanocyte differentiation-associated protein [Thalassophryne amazonica]
MDPEESGACWLSFAHQNLSEIPSERILMHGRTLQLLDLSHNLLDEYPSNLVDTQTETMPSQLFSFIQVYWNPVLLGSLEKLSTLVLDSNSYTSHVKFPYMPSITALSVNKNRITNLPVFVQEVQQRFPNIKILSMMNNEAAPSYFNGGTLTQHKDYRQYVISQIPGLQILDDTEVLEEEWVKARKTYRLHRHSRKKTEASSAKKGTKSSHVAVKHNAPRSRAED